MEKMEENRVTALDLTVVGVNPGATKPAKGLSGNKGDLL